jgi:hypothetical protein
VTTELFFSKFERFAEIPGAIAAIRVVILEWATTGRLATAAFDDEHAVALLTRIERHLERLRRRDAAGTKQGGALLEADDLPPLPSNWAWVPLGNVVDYGSAPKVESKDISGDAWLVDLEEH